MGQVLAFAHCKESPSTASTTPDSTEGGNDESDFPELQTAREFSEDEEEASVEWGTPRELTFSYITIAGGLGINPTTGENGSRSRRDSQTRQTRAVLPHTETCETFVPALGDSLENIPSLCPSPEGEGASPPGHCQGLDPFSTWDVDTGYGNEAAAAEKGRGVDLSPQHSSTAAAAAAEGARGSTLSSSVADLVYWRDTRKSTFVFTSLMVALLCLLHFSIVSVVSYLSLAVLTVTISLRVYSKVLHAIHRGEGTNPFQAQLDADLGLSKEQLERLTERVVFYATSGTRSVQRLFLVDDLVESIKFAFLFYILTYVGAVFNGMTLLILGVISAFTFPLLYRQHQAQIDQYVGLVRNQLSNLRAKMLAKLPTAKAKAE
ncbi:reticulon-2 isoform X2 [Sphaerodactylus townsendi]|uniref:reticulon-2 isoform X2 n=1 Tax=Sphaerodactylus townsendi TaxID=933632 RepID=UPI002025EA5E|nr:reticulon-2 isoform X2 [Sphaerodactylus townsendi]